MPAKEARCLAWDCPRISRGRGGHGGAGCPVRARAGDHRAGAPGRYAKASKKDKGRMLDKESIPLLLDLLEASGELDDEPRYQDPQGR